MNLENYIFGATFIINGGLAAFCILFIYTLFKRYKKEYFQTLLFQQIFLYSYFLYGIWGNIAIHKGLDKLNLEQHTYESISFYIPILGMPFLIISWYMLIKFVFQIKGYRIQWYYTLVFFIGVILCLVFASYTIQTNDYQVFGTNEELIKRCILLLNLILNVALLISFFKRFKLSDFKAKAKEINYAILGHIGFVALYTFGLWFTPNYHYLVSVASFLLISVSAMFLPMMIWRIAVQTNISTEDSKLDFEAFCKKFEISKREAEIIHEICQGKSNKDIAETLFITLQTVKDHTHRIYTKTGIKNRVHLTNLVREIGKK